MTWALSRRSRRARTTISSSNVLPGQLSELAGNATVIGMGSPAPGDALPLRDHSPLSRFPLRRYTSRELPAYRHIPGYSPHPVRDAAGHSFRRPEPQEVCPLGYGQWRECGDYLYGVDLFNHKFFWEAHEVWEPIWHEAGHDSAGGRFVQALIQMAAVMLLHRSERPGGIPKLLQRAAKNFSLARERAGRGDDDDALYGVNMARWQRGVRTYIEASATSRFPYLVLEGL